MSDRLSVPYGLGPRCAAFLRTRYPEGEVIKGVMRDLRCGRSRAKELLAGYAPTTPQLEEMVQLWGDDLLMAVFAEAWGRLDQRIKDVQHHEAEVREQLKAMEERVAQLEALIDFPAKLAPDHLPTPVPSPGDPPPTAQLSLGKERFHIGPPKHRIALSSLVAELHANQPISLWRKARIWFHRIAISA